MSLSNILKGSLVIMICCITTSAHAFIDTDRYSWKNSISSLESTGIIQGYANSTFKPNTRINRAEFTKVVIASISTPQEYEAFKSPCFPDVAKDSWMNPYICFAKSQGIINGHPDGQFHPGDYVNQSEALKILLRSFGHAQKTTEGEWYTPYFDTATDLGMFYFATPVHPSYEITRGEMSYFTAWLLAKRDNTTPPDQLLNAETYQEPFTYTITGETHVVTMVANRVDMKVLTGNNSIRPKECNYPHHCVAEATSEDFESYAKRSDASLLINGPFFDGIYGEAGYYHQIASDIIIDGEMKSMYGWDQAFGNGGMLAQFLNGDTKIIHPIRDWLKTSDKIQQGISNYPLILENGKVRTKDDIEEFGTKDEGFWTSTRRGGLGLSPDYNTILYVNTIGTVEDLGRRMLEHGALSGFALDAGSSNGMYYMGESIFNPGRDLPVSIAFTLR